VIRSVESNTVKSMPLLHVGDSIRLSLFPYFLIFFFSSFSFAC